MTNRTIENYYDKQHNNFTIISLIMSLIIIYYHSYPLYYGPGTPDPVSKLLGIGIGGIVVYSFFIISGFHITTSLQKNERWYIFWINRLFKLLPSLVLFVFISSFIVCPLIIKMPYFEYIKTPSIYIQFVKDNLLLWHNSSYEIMDVFSKNPYPSAINGSIWIIKHFFFCYLFLFFIKITGKLEDKKFMLFLFFFILFLDLLSIGGLFNNYYNHLRSLFPNIGIITEFNWFLDLLLFFMSGVIMNLYSDKIDLNAKLFLSTFILWFLFKKILLINYAIIFLLPYMIIFIGTKKSNIKIKDISYNIYIFAFFLQQLIIYYFYSKISFSQFVCMGMVISIVVGLLLYFLLDKNIKKIKEKILRRIKYD
jgi:peptidoglycan/LPS O-acetylase OafA/YrhL